MTRAFKSRLQRLERQISNDPMKAMVDWSNNRILHYAIACYVGGPSPNDSQKSGRDVLQLAEDAYGRALGYSDSDELEKHRNDPELQRRYQEALDKLLLQFGVDRDGKGMDAALERMQDEFPEDYKKCVNWIYVVL